jgi:hypothetical protein
MKFLGKPLPAADMNFFIQQTIFGYSDSGVLSGNHAGSSGMIGRDVWPPEPGRSFLVFSGYRHPGHHPSGKSGEPEYDPISMRTMTKSRVAPIPHFKV